MQQLEDVCDLRIGTRLKRLQTELARHGEKLAPLVDPSNRELVEDSVRRAVESPFNVAVVGQIKAGKSSFINALIQRPGFIPTNINPWTTAVTRLVFNERPCDGSEGIVRFFDESEWERLLEPDGKLGELAAKFVPGYDMSLVRRNLEAIRQQARDRLGDDFGSLLGSEHRIERVTTDVLSQYVCAAQEDTTSLVGRYSDVTRSADIFLRDGPFDIRTTILDTPGTNDPYLFRDEITHRALADADTYVVLLTARQPLSGSDLALLRLLRSLQKSRIIVFVNRVDELDHEEGDIQAVRHLVRRRLDEEWPGQEIPLILGSAMWANFALADDETMLKLLLKPGTLAAMQHLGGYVRPEQLASLDQAAIIQVARQAMFVASGLPQVYEALDGSLASAPNTIRQHDLCRSLIGFAQARRLARIRSVPSAATKRHPEVTADLVEKIEGLHAQLQQASGTVMGAITELRRESERLALNDTKHLREMLSKEVATAAKLAAEQVRRATLRRNSHIPWRFQTSLLRRHLAHHLELAFEITLKRITELEERVLPRLNKLLSEFDPSHGLELQRPASSGRINVPSLSGMSEPSAFDLEDSLWEPWWRAHMEPEQRGEQIDGLVRSEFEKVIEKLTASFHDALGRHIESTSKWSAAVSNEVIRSLGAQHEQIREIYLRQRGSGSASRGEDGRQELDLLATDLKHLDRDFDQFIENAKARQAS